MIAAVDLLQAGYFCCFPVSSIRTEWCLSTMFIQSEYFRSVCKLGLHILCFLWKITFKLWVTLPLWGWVLWKFAIEVWSFLVN